MEVTEIFKRCQAEGVQLGIEDGNLDVSFENDISDELIGLLKAHKAQIIDFIAQRQRPTQHNAKIVPTERAGALPLSYAQQRLWFIDSMEGGSAHYNMPTALKVSGRFDITAAEQAISRIIERHEPLRTVFRQTKQGPEQAIVEQFEFHLKVHDLTAIPASEQAQQVLQLRQADVEKTFDLSQDLMLRSSFVLLSSEPGQEQGVLLFNMHHIASDGWSVQVLVAEFMTCFAALSDGSVAQMPPLEVQYIDFAHWQRQAMNNGLWDEQLTFWQNYLSDIPQLHSLPLDYARPTVQGYAAACVEQHIQGSMYQQLVTLANAHNVSLFLLLQSAFALLLARLSGEQDIVMGVPSSGRTEPNLEPLIGFFINLLTFRSDLSANPTFKQLLEQSKADNAAIFANQDVPYELVIEKLNPDRSLAFNPVCQIKFMLLPAPTALPQLPGVTMEPVEAVNQKVRFDLDLSITESAEGLSLAWTYKTELFRQNRVVSMAESFEHLLGQLLADIDKPVQAYSLVGGSQRQHLLGLGQGPISPWPGDNLVGAFQAQALKTPEAIAVAQGDSGLTYRQLNEKANRLAHCLLEQELEDNSFVAVYLNQSPALMIALLAVLKAGYAYIPLDPLHSKARLDDILEDADVEVVLSNEEVLNDIASGNVDLLSVDDWLESDWFSEYETHNIELEHCGKNNAYLLYTSGSTGKPKGVKVSHNGLFDYCMFAANRYYNEALEGALLVGSHAFDISVPSLFVPLLKGGVVQFNASVGDLVHIADILKRGENNYLLRMTPMHALAILDLLPMSWQSTSAHVFVIGGEQLTVGLAKRLQSTFTHAQIYNHYGPSEAVVGCAMFDVTANIESLTDCVPIGQPMDNHQLYVLDANQQPVPAMIEGELYIAGAGVVAGYLKRDELTAKVFVDNPFTQGKMYRTGDRVRWNNFGALEFVGRNDNQVKIRGYRIEPEDVRKHLGQLKEVQSAAVVVKKDKLGLDILIAYVVAAVEYNETGELIARIQAELKAELPEYMCPAAFVVVDALPLNANGKINFAALPEPEFMAQSSYIAPSTEVEKAMALLWQSLLKVERVGLSDSFFELGGHSLLATRLIGQIREQFDSELTLKDVFAHPTIGGLCELIDEPRSNGKLPAIEKAAQVVDTLSFAQQRLWFIRQLQKDDSQYNMPGMFALEGQLNMTALEAAFTTIIERHQVLRTLIKTVDGQPKSQLLECFELPLSVTDLSKLEDEVYRHKIDQLAQQDALKPFDLANDLMVRVHLIKRDQNQHVLLLNMHHIASDGWSINILLNEFATVYNALSQQQRYELPKLSVQYSDYAHWQASLVKGEFLEQQLSYWSDTLANLPQQHSLPLSRMRSNEVEGAQSVVLQQLNPALSKQIKAYCQSQGVTLHMFMLCAFSLLLSRYSNETDIVIGTASSGRVDPALDPLIGFFVNDLVYRAEVSAEQSFAQHLQVAKQTLLSAHEHQYVPFEQLVEMLNPVRQLNLHPLYQIKLDIRNHVEAAQQLHQLQLNSINRNFAKAKYDLYLAVDELSDALQINWLYDEHLFDGEIVKGMVSSFNCLLNGLVTQPAAAVGGLDLIDQNTKQQLQSMMLPTQAANRQSDLCLHQWFERQVELTPDATALVAVDEHGEQPLSYAQLNQKANRLARLLRTYGVVAETLVGLAVSRTNEMVVSILAILKAGGAYVPLDPSNPKDRLSYIVEDTGINLLLTESSIDAQFDGPQQLNRLLLDSPSVAEQLAEQSADNLVTEADAAQNLVYIIYTSGSTGKPKGVMQTQANVVRLFKATEANFDFSSDDVWTLFHSVAFDFSVWELWGALLYGGKLIVPSLAVVKDTAAFVALCRRFEVSVLNQTPGAFLAFSQVALAQPSLAHLRYVIFGGEALNIENLLPWWQQYDENQPKLINMYGITETTVHVTFKHVTQADIGSSVIGKGLIDLKLYLLDNQMQLVPPGVVGELYVGGAGLARGYWQKPQLSAERFVENPFSHCERLYRTGDLMRYLSNGELAYVGRCDDQVKVRGFRIELGEIEQSLMRHQDVASCLVLVQKDAFGQNALVAYIKWYESGDIQTLKSWLATKLPYYMCPAGLCVIDQWPLTGNGKIDKAALPIWQFSDESVYQAPTTELEQQLVTLWAELLQLSADEISVNASFFDLGGHSLLATQLVGAIASSLGVQLSVRTLFENATIAALAQQLEKLPQHQSSAITVVRAERNPLSFAQQRFWFIDQMAQGAQHYNTASTFDIRGTLDFDAVTQTVQLMMARHDILRTQFVREGDEVYQLVASDVAAPVHFIELTALDEQQERVKQLAVASAKHIFDLSRGPLFKIDVVTVAENRHVMMVCMHHIICDGWSMTLMIEEFSTIYSALVNHQNVPLLPLSLQYGDYALWQRERFDNGELAAELDYWQTQLQGLPELHCLPIKAPHSGQQSFTGKLFEQVLDKTLTEQVRQYCKDQDVTLFMFLHSLFAVLLHKYSEEQDIVVGTPIAGRVRPEFEPLIGCFLNTLVLRCEIDTEQSFNDMLQQQKNVVLDAFEHQQIPFEVLVESLKPQRSDRYNPLCQVKFVLQNFRQTEFALPGMQLTDAHYAEHDRVRFDLDLTANEQADAIELSWNYKVDLFDHQTIVAMASSFEQLLRTVLTESKLAIGQIDCLTEQQTQELLNLGTGRANAAGRDESIVTLFERQAELTPDAVAVFDENHSVSYRQLAQKVSRFAEFLIEQELEQDEAVVICLGRCAELLIANLAVLKTGCRYIPVDPDFNAQRIAHILADANVAIVVSLSAHSDAFNSSGADMVVLDDALSDDDWLADYDEGSAVLGNMDSVAYTIYTSGSTGKPKGVEITHLGLSDYCQFALEGYYHDELDGSLVVTSPGFDITLPGLYLPLLRGHSVEMLSTQDSLECLLEHLMQQQSRDCLIRITPSYLKVVLDRFDSAFVCEQAHTFVIGGESLSAELVAQVRRQFPNAAIYNHYGPTEAVVGCCINPLDTDAELSTGSLPIGRPMDNTSLLVLSPDMRLLPRGVPGELFVGGYCVAKGYTNLAEQSAEKFVASKWALAFGQRLYRTGDVVRWRDDGLLEFCGRIDNQVKINGFRVELDQIKSLIADLSMVNDAAVGINTNQATDSRYLCAYIAIDDYDAVAQQADWPTRQQQLIKAIKSELSNELPAHLLPAAFVFMAKLPLNDNAKVDMQALANMEQVRQHHGELTEPRNSFERLVQQIWQSLLGIETIGVMDNFFDLGGHSLLVFQLINQVQSQFKVELLVKDVFEHRTLEALAECIAQRADSRQLSSALFENDEDMEEFEL